MAFYPDEFSPIERLRSLGKPPELTDMNLMSLSRRQWKSLVLGKKDLGFATIAEEKEEDMSSDGSNAANSQAIVTNVPNKKITFPRPRKYITCRVAERKEEAEAEEDHLRGADESSRPAAKETPSPSDKPMIADDASRVVNSPKMNLPEVRLLLKGKKIGAEDVAAPKREVIVNYAFNEANIDKQWKEATAAPPPLLGGWPKHEDEKAKTKEEKKRPAPGKAQSRKTDPKKPPQDGVTKPSKTEIGEDKSKSLNMKDVVNVYKNLTYGTKDEIKSFVEKLSFVKDEEKTESDKNALSMMNLKALETKIKDLEKKTGHGAPQTKKRGKTGKKARKLHTESLARHKVVKVPATLDYTYSPDSRNVSYGAGSASDQRRKSGEEKVPWRYVGTQSVLDKTYFVYPSYPQPERRRAGKRSEAEGKKAKKDGPEDGSTQRPGQPPPTKPAKPSQSKVKTSKEIFLSHSPGIGTSRSVNGLAFPANRSSATTVCTVEFRPGGERKSQGWDHSLLVYLHGTKATHVKSPYSDKQFSRVKVFRKEGARTPLVRGRGVGDPAAGRAPRPAVPPASDRARDLLDFEEDIQNINDFLRSQGNPSGGAATGKRENSSSSSGGSSNRGDSPRRARPRPSRRRRPASGDAIIDELTRDIDGLQYLPDTEKNRQIIAQFFDELDRRIERSKAQHLLGDNNNNNSNNCLIPIVGY